MADRGLWSNGPGQPSPVSRLAAANNSPGYIVQQKTAPEAANHVSMARGPGLVDYRLRNRPWPLRRSPADLLRRVWVGVHRKSIHQQARLNCYPQGVNRSVRRVWCGEGSSSASCTKRTLQVAAAWQRMQSNAWRTSSLFMIPHR